MARQPLANAPQRRRRKRGALSLLLVGMQKSEVMFALALNFPNALVQGALPDRGGGSIGRRQGRLKSGEFCRKGRMWGTVVNGVMLIGRQERGVGGEG